MVLVTGHETRSYRKTLGERRSSTDDRKGHNLTLLMKLALQLSSTFPKFGKRDWHLSGVFSASALLQQCRGAGGKGLLFLSLLFVVLLFAIDSL